MNETILLVEDEPSIADNVIYALETEGFRVLWQSSGKDAMSVLETESIDLILLDIGLPDISGFDLAREIRKRFDLPIIFLTARNNEVDRVVGLEIGGDDYVGKPFSPRELTARVRAVLRRSAGMSRPPEPSPKPAAEPPFVVDDSRYCVRFRGKKLDLSRYEFRLMRVLATNPGRVFTREMLMQEAWDEPDMSLDRTVDTHIKTIRRKLRSVDPDQEWIVTHRGIGYSLKEFS